MLEGRNDHGRRIAADRLKRLLQAGKIVVVEVHQVGPVFGDDTARIGGAPGGCTVIRVASHQHLATAGGRARNRHAQGGRIGAVLLEQRPIGMGQEGHQPFGQFDHARTRPGHEVAQAGLARDRFIDLRMAIAHDHRAIGTHEIDHTSAIGIAQSTALGGFKKLRVIGRQGSHIHMAEHAARNDAPGAFAQRVITRSVQTG